MPGPWLYVISEGADREFTLEPSGESIPVTLESFRQLVENGRIVEDRHWYISQLWKDIAIGDEVFIYSGDKDIGIIGYATVLAIEKKAGDWAISPQFNLERTKLLLQQPISAPAVREWVYPRRNVTDLSAVRDKLQSYLPW
jgi:hypothetical protein